MLGNKRNSLIFQLSLTITMFIVVIEGILLVTSFMAKRAELHRLNAHIESEMLERYQVKVEKPLSDSYIENRLKRFSFNIIVLTLIIICAVVAGTVYVFHRVAFKPLAQIIQFYKDLDINDLRAIPSKDRPNNEIGELIDAQNRVLYELIKEQNLADQAQMKVKQAIRFYQNNPGPVMRINRKGQIIIANGALNRLLKCESCVGQNVRDLFPEIREFDLNELAGANSCTQKEFHIMGSTFLFSIVGNKNENTLNIYGTNITQMQELRTKVMHSSKLASIGQLAANVAHEINNPLAILLGNIELVESYLETGQLNDSVLKSSLSKQIKSINRISDIVKHLRMFTRSDTQTEEFDAVELLDEVQSMLHGIMNSANVDLQFEMSASSRGVTGVPGQFQQVLINLLNNAKDALEEKRGGRISVRAYNMHKNLVIEVEDNGSGISEENLARIFDSFFTTKKRGQGTGLGLDISKSIVSEMGGEIRVESVLGKGTTFTIELPCHEVRSHAISVEEIIDELPKLKAKVLIVDDEEDIRVLLEQFIEGHVDEVSTAADGELALEKFNEKSYDLVLSDAIMPKINGFELSEKIRQCSSNCKIILMTGESDPDIDISELGVDRLLLKPFSRSQVIEVVMETLLEDSELKNKAA